MTGRYMGGLVVNGYKLRSEKVFKNNIYCQLGIRSQCKCSHMCVRHRVIYIEMYLNTNSLEGFEIKILLNTNVMKHSPGHDNMA